MSLARIWWVLRKDLRLGPQSPLVVWAIVIPVMITLLVRGVFGDLFGEVPRIGVVDTGSSAITTALVAREGLEVQLIEDRDVLRAEVTDGSLDAGVVLPAGFDQAVRDGQRPPLEAWLSGESLPSTRAVITATLLDEARALTDDDAPVDVEVVVLGDEVLPLDLRLLPLIVLYAVAIPGGMVPASSLVEEKEHGTLHAMLATPASVREVLAAKGLLGVALGCVAGIVTLWLNDAFGASAGVLLASLLLGATMMALIGLLFGAWAPDTTTLFAAWKAGGLVLFLPAVFFIWPGLPTWPTYAMPTYYFLRPAYEASVEGAGLGEVGWLLAVAAAICVALVPVVAAAARRLERVLVAGRPDGQDNDTPSTEATDQRGEPASTAAPRTPR